MGYMGFGLQNWIYNQKPRKGFDKYKQYIDVEDSKKNLDYHGSIEDFNKIIDYKMKKRKQRLLWKGIFVFFVVLMFLFILSMA